MNIFRLILFLLCLAAAPFALAAEETPSVEQSGLDAWDLMLQNREKQLQVLDQEITGLRTEVRSLSPDVKKQIADMESEHQRLVSISRVSRGQPMELTVVQAGLLHLKQRLQATTSSVEDRCAALQDQLAELSLLDDSDVTTTGTVNSDLQNFQKKLQQVQTKLDTVRTQANRVLKPAEQLSENIAKEQKQLSEQVPLLWRDFYIQRTSRIYDRDFWTNIRKNMASMQEMLVLRAGTEVPATQSVWVEVFLRGLMVFVPLQLLLLLTRRLSRKWPPVFHAGWVRLSSNGLFWILLGISIHFAAWSSSGIFHALSVVGTLLMSFGQMAMAWDMYAFERPDLPRSTPLWPLFAPLLCGLILLLVNLPGPLLGIAWLIVLAVALWRDVHRGNVDAPNNRGESVQSGETGEAASGEDPVEVAASAETRDVNSPLVVNLLRFHVAALWIAVIMTMLGWGRLSILVCMVYAAFAVCLQQAVGLVRLASSVSGAIASRNITMLIMNFLIALAVPVLIVVVTLATGLWLLAYPGGWYMLSYMASFDFSVGESSFNIVQILFIFSAFFITRSVISVARSVIAELPARGISLDATLVPPIQAGLTYILWCLFGLYTLSALGFSLSSLAMVAGGLSVGIGFGMQNIINNFISGLLMIFGRTLREGDVIEVGENLMGVVKKINVRSTLVETFDNATIFVPNSEFLSGRLTNWTRNGRKVRKQINIGVAYGSDIPRVVSLLKEIACAHPDVVEKERTTVLFQDFGGSSLDFSLLFWVEDILRGAAICSELRAAIDKRFNEEKIEIAFPQLDVHLRQNEQLPVLVKKFGQEDDSNTDRRSPNEGF